MVEVCLINRETKCPLKNNHLKPYGCLGMSALTRFLPRTVLKERKQRGQDRWDTGRRYRETGFQKMNFTCNIALLKISPIHGETSCCGSEFSYFPYCYEVSGHRSNVNGDHIWPFTGGHLLHIWRETGLLSKPKSRLLWVNLDANILRNLILSLNSH